MGNTSKIKEAFKEQGNILGMAGAIALSFALVNPLPLIAAVVAEAGYLLFVPDSQWFARRLAKRYDEEINERRRKLKEQILPTLSPAMQDRYLRLESTRDQIYSECNNDERPWFREVLRKLDFLLEKFLLFGGKEVQFRNYIATVLEEVEREAGKPPRLDDDAAGGKWKAKKRVSPLNDDAPDEIFLNPETNWVTVTVKKIQDSYTDQCKKIDAWLESQGETDLHNKAILEKRKEVIERRHEYVGRIGSILTNLNHQSRLMEDTFGLINDEIRARSPEQVLADIEDVVSQTNVMTEALEEVAPFEQMVARLSA